VPDMARIPINNESSDNHQKPVAQAAAQTRSSI
jgi:hypothetical protein